MSSSKFGAPGNRESAWLNSTLLADDAPTKCQIKKLSTQTKACLESGGGTKLLPQCITCKHQLALMMQETPCVQLGMPCDPDPDRRVPTCNVRVACVRARRPVAHVLPCVVHPMVCMVAHACSSRLASCRALTPCRMVNSMHSGVTRAHFDFKKTFSCAWRSCTFRH